jgi:hypothetical protein
MNTFRVCPAVRCHAPGLALPTAVLALEAARQLANRHRMPFVVWKRQGSTCRILSRVEPAK